MYVIITKLFYWNFSHRDRFYAWHNVFRIAHSVGGNFSCILQLSNYIKLQLRASTEEKIQSRSKINEVDTLMFKIFDDLDGSGLEFLSDHQVPVETQHGCRICQITFHRFDELRLHQQMHHGQALEQDFARKCRLCGKNYNHLLITMLFIFYNYLIILIFR